MELQEEVLVFTANFVALGFNDLTDCLKKNGALRLLSRGVCVCPRQIRTLH